MKPSEVRAGQSYVGRARVRRVRHVLAVGSPETCEISEQERKFLDKKSKFVRYRSDDGTETWEALVSFAQWAAGLDMEWPREDKAGKFYVDLVGRSITAEVHGPLTVSDARRLVRFLRDAVRDAEEPEDVEDY